ILFEVVISIPKQLAHSRVAGRELERLPIHLKRSGEHTTLAKGVATLDIEFGLPAIAANCSLKGGCGLVVILKSRQNHALIKMGFGEIWTLPTGLLVGRERADIVSRVISDSTFVVPFAE